MLAEMLEKMLAAMLVELKDLIPQEEIALSLVRVALKFVPEDTLHASLTAEAKKRADDAADAAAALKFGPE
jgi:hypothetical protein